MKHTSDIIGGWGHDHPAKVILVVESESAKIGFLEMAYCEVIPVAIAILSFSAFGGEISYLSSTHQLWMPSNWGAQVLRGLSNWQKKSFYPTFPTFESFRANFHEINP